MRGLVELCRLIKGLPWQSKSSHQDKFISEERALSLSLSLSLSFYASDEMAQGQNVLINSSLTFIVLCFSALHKPVPKDSLVTARRPLSASLKFVCSRYMHRTQCQGVSIVSKFCSALHSNSIWSSFQFTKSSLLFNRHSCRLSLSLSHPFSSELLERSPHLRMPETSGILFMIMIGSHYSFVCLWRCFIHTRHALAKHSW